MNVNIEQDLNFIINNEIHFFDSEEAKELSQRLVGKGI